MLKLSVTGRFNACCILLGFRADFETENLNDMSIHIDKNIGISGAKIHWMRSKCGKMHWCRMAIAIMGRYNMTKEEIATISPFDPSNWLLTGYFPIINRTHSGIFRTKNE